MRYASCAGVALALCLAALIVLAVGADEATTSLPDEGGSDSSQVGEEIRWEWKRIITFSGYQWGVRHVEDVFTPNADEDTPIGPGPNFFSLTNENVWVDEQGRLHLKITHRDGRWYCAGVTSLKSFGYGKYVFYTASRVDQLDRNVVLGVFTWDEAPEYAHREIDIECARWGEDTEINGQFATWPARPGKYRTFPIQLRGEYATHIIDWRSDRISFQSLRGHQSTPPDEEHVIASWTYVGDDIPRPGNEKANMNLWLFKSMPPSDGREVEVVIARFEFVPHEVHDGP